MPSPDEKVEVDKLMSIATYSLTVPTLVFWTGLLVRMLISKDRDKLRGLIVISILMIVA